MTITVISLTSGEFLLPNGQFLRFAPDGTPGLGRSVELQGEGEFIGTELRDFVISDDDLDKTIFGFEGDDVLSLFGTGSARFSGNAGGDSFTGSFGNDTFYAGTGEDSGNGGDGNDLMFGDVDNDFLEGGLGNDTLYGGPGDDLLSGLTFFDDPNQSVGTEDNFYFGGSGNDQLNGSQGNEFLSGDTGNDMVSGDGSRDTLSGGDGFDILTGGDILPPGELFTGDDAVDVFALEVNNGFDKIIDFEDNIDKIGLVEGLTFEDLLIAPVGDEADLLLNQFTGGAGLEIPVTSEGATIIFPEAILSTDIAIKLAATGQVLAVINSNLTGDGLTPVLDASQITSEDFITL